MQVRAIVSATLHLGKLSPSIHVYPSLSLPFITSEHEVEKLVSCVRRSIREEYANHNLPYNESSLYFTIGASISTPRASMCSGELASLVNYISFDIHGMTELVYGCTENIACKFMPQYLRGGIWDTNPFERIDDCSVGALIQSSIENARRANPKVKIFAVSDKHTCDSESVHRLRSLKVDTISCAATKIALSKLISTQASILSTENGLDSTETLHVPFVYF